MDPVELAAFTTSFMQQLKVIEDTFASRQSSDVHIAAPITAPVLPVLPVQVPVQSRILAFVPPPSKQYLERSPSPNPVQLASQKKAGVPHFRLFRKKNTKVANNIVANRKHQRKLHVRRARESHDPSFLQDEKPKQRLPLHRKAKTPSTITGCKASKYYNKILKKNN